MLPRRAVCPVPALAAGLAVLLAPLGAAGQVGITAQDRSVEASSQSFGSLWQENQNPFFPDFEAPAFSLTDTASDSAAAPDEDPFDEAASTLDPPLGGLAPAGSASAAQTSSLDSAAIAATGSFTAVGHSRTLSALELAGATALLMPPFPYDFGTLGDSESASSDFSVTFSVDSATTYSLSASVAVSALELIIPFQGFELTSAAATVALTGPSGLVHSLSLDQLDFCPVEPCSPASDALDADGTLPPGSYTLTASVTGTAGGTCTEVPGFSDFQCHTPTADGSFDVSLTLGEPAAEVPALPPGGVVLLAVLLLASGTLRSVSR